MNPILRFAQKLGLKRNLMFGYVVLLGLVGLFMFLALNLKIGDTLQKSLVQRGRSMVSSLAARSHLPLLQRDAKEARRIVDEALQESDVAYVVLVAADGRTVLGEGFHGDALGGESRKDVLAGGLRRIAALPTLDAETADGERAVAVEQDEVESFVQRVVGTRYTESPADTAEADEELLLGDGVGQIAATATPKDGAGKSETLGYLLLGLSKAPVEGALQQVNAVIGLVIGGALVAFFLLSVFITRFLVMRPLTSMKTAARRMSDFDLTGRSEKFADDELGEMSDAMNRLGENLHGVLGRVQGVVDSIASVSERVARTSEVVARGSASTATGVDQTGSSMQEMLASLKGIADNVEMLAQSAEESSSSILEMAATNDEVAQNIASLAASVEETTTAIEQMTYSIKEVAKNVEDLSSTAEETSSSMNEMDVSISQVEQNANETARLSEQVSTDARTAAEALGKTIEGIDNIRDSSQTAADVIEALGQKIATIGNILNVIDDVAEQTNLLALNAAIIAAQAGEHGKGFAVVADEIKDLAERTGASTKEIAELIRSVQDESKNAIGAMEKGVKSVDEGVRLSGEAEKALQQITASAGKSTQMVKAIARATVEQARGSKQVTGAINRIAETVQEIARATAEQARGSEQIMKQAERMKIITKHVERSSQEQARGSKQITQAIENISEMVQHLNRAQKEQTQGAEQVMLAVENIKDATDAQNSAVKDLEAAVDTMAEQAEVLRGEARRFRI